MEFKTTRASAIENLDNFIKNSLGEYSKLRNFDFKYFFTNILHIFTI